MRLFTIFLLLGSTAFAISPSAARELQNRGEARKLVAEIADGQGVLGAVARLQFLGEERYAATQLAKLIDTPDVEARRNVAQALDALAAPNAERPLSELATDEDGAVRMSAVEGLGRIHSKKVRVVLPLLFDKTLGVRKAAARTLGAMHLARLGRILVRAAKTESEPEVREAILYAVGQSGDRRQAKPLARFLKSTSESTRVVTAQALCMLGAREGFAFAEKLLNDPDPSVRRQGVMLFEGSSAKISSRYLEPRLEDSDSSVSAPAARILYQGGERAALQWLVLASAHAQGEAKFPFEDELERLEITDAQRQAILKRAGIR